MWHKCNKQIPKAAPCIKRVAVPGGGFSKEPPVAEDIRKNVNVK